MSPLEKIMRFYLTTNEFIAWHLWHDNLEYLCTEEKKLIEVDAPFVAAWLSAKVLRCSYERNNLRIRGVGTLFDPHKDLRHRRY